MENHFNTPAEVVDLSIKACENKTKLPVGKMILLGIMAGVFIALGGATSSTAAHAVENVGVARALAGVIFPVGLMLIVFLGGELFTGNCLIIMDVFDKRVTWAGLFRDLFIVFFSNLIGALCVDVLIVFSGNLNYSGGLLGAYTIKVAVSKIAISPVQGITSGILCNILVCLAVLMATSARDIAGKVWAIFFPICAFVVGGFEHCVANMFYHGCHEPGLCGKSKGRLRTDRRTDCYTDTSAQPAEFYPGYFGKYDRWYVVRRTSALPDLQEKMELI